MSRLEEVYGFSHVNPDGRNYRSEFSLDGQRFRSPIFAPMHGASAEQRLAPGQCREPKLNACSAKQDPWLWTAGKQGCTNSQLCSPIRDTRSQFVCKNRHCQSVPNKNFGCQAVPFRKTFAGDIVKSNYNIDNLASLPWRISNPNPLFDLQPTVSHWTPVPNIQLLRSTDIGFDLTMYNR